MPDGLETQPQIGWLSPEGETLTSAGGLTVGRQQVAGNPSRLTTYMVQFSPLLTSHGGMYTCQATISSPYGTIQQTEMTTQNVSVQSKLPLIKEPLAQFHNCLITWSLVTTFNSSYQCSFISCPDYRSTNWHCVCWELPNTQLLHPAEQCSGFPSYSDCCLEKK